MFNAKDHPELHRVMESDDFWKSLHEEAIADGKSQTTIDRFNKATTDKSTRLELIEEYYNGGDLSPTEAAEFEKFKNIEPAKPAVKNLSKKIVSPAVETPAPVIAKERSWFGNLFKRKEKIITTSPEANLLDKYGETALIGAGVIGAGWAAYELTKSMQPHSGQNTVQR